MATKKSAPQTMEELLNKKNYQLVIPQKGQIIKGVITEKQKKCLIVDLGAKTEGAVVDKEFDFASEFIKDLKEGDEISAVVISSENDRGQVILSLKGAASDAKWQYFEDAFKNDTSLKAKGVEINRGGLIVEVNGVRGFVPSSQFGRKYVGKIQQLKGQAFEVKPIEVDREKNRLIFSERHVSEAKELSQKDLAVEKVKSGEIYEGVISGVMHFGLFVTVEIPVDKKNDNNIGYVEGLIHISEISWEKVNHPKDLYKVGDRVKVKVLGIDEKTEKLNLSIKQLQDDPWQKISDKYQAGTTFTGKVSRIESFGVFVNVEPGVDGLIHSTKLDPNKELNVGDEVTVNVESVDPAQRRMSLSIVLTEVPIGYK
jgi:small subunit ribosomal protein S1